MAKQTVILEKTWQQNPLFWPGQGDLVVPDSRSNIFIGIGITAADQPSQTIPFDELGFLLSAEFIRRKIPNSQVFVFIADQHAWLANNLNVAQAKKMASRQSDFIVQCIKLLRLENWQVALASHLFPQAQTASYEQLEQRDVAFFINHHHVGIKIGWRFSRQRVTHKTDEAHFDKLLKGKLLQSLFVKPGMTLNHQKIHESPYICSDPDTRIVISSREDVVQKIKVATCNRAQKEAVKNHLRKTVLLFEVLTGKFPYKIRLEEKVRLINDFIFS